MNIDHLRAFHKIAQTGSFTKAARELFLTQPAVSQQIQLLESFLGSTLFDRSGKKVSLTSQGEILLSHTERLFELFQEIEMSFGRLQNLEKGKITIGSTAVLGTYFLPKMIGSYNKQYPGIDLDLQMGNSDRVHNMLLDGSVDVGFAGRIRPNSRLKDILIHRENLLVVTSPDNPLATKKSVSVDEMIKIPFIWREKGTQTRALVESWFKKKVGPNYPRKSIELQNLEAAKRTVVEGYGITIAPEIAVRRELHLGLLKCIDLVGFDLYFDYYVFYLKRKIMSKAMEVFIDLISHFRLLTHAENLRKQLMKAQ
jgi:DNA-binding transcriptional LysR family regulator